MKKVLFVVLAGLALAACTPEAAKKNREALIAEFFPDPADRVGLELVFPVNDGRKLEIIYNPAVVSQETVMERAAKHCANRFEKDVSLTKGPTEGTRTLEDGTKIPMIQNWIKCV